MSRHNYSFLQNWMFFRPSPHSLEAGNKASDMCVKVVRISVGESGIYLHPVYRRLGCKSRKNQCHIIITVEWQRVCGVSNTGFFPPNRNINEDFSKSKRTLIKVLLRTKSQQQECKCTNKHCLFAAKLIADLYLYGSLLQIHWSGLKTMLVLKL